MKLIGENCMGYSILHLTNWGKLHRLLHIENLLYETNWDKLHVLCIMNLLYVSD
jgi:hypothetical protein